MKGDLLGIRVSALIPHHWETGVMVHFHHWVEVLALKEPAPVSKVQRPRVKMPEVCPMTEAGGPGACSIYGFRPLVPGMTMVPYAQPPFQESTLHRGSLNSDYGPLSQPCSLLTHSSCHRHSNVPCAIKFKSNLFHSQITPPF